MVRMVQDHPDLFLDYYPRAPGWRDPETSREAAEKISPKVLALRKLVLDYITEHPLKTADDIALGMKRTPRSIQPRVSELRAMGLIVNDGRGLNPSGHSAHLWRRA